VHNRIVQNLKFSLEKMQRLRACDKRTAIAEIEALADLAAFNGGRFGQFGA
jgi:hypothetical protein